MSDKSIELHTVQNGYQLTVGKNKYMYFTPDSLIEGFLFRVGMGISGNMDTDTIRQFVNTAVRWNENKECIKEIQRLNDVLFKLRRNRGGIVKRFVHERAMYNALVDEILVLKSDLKKCHDKELYAKYGKLTKEFKRKTPLTIAEFGSREDLEDSFKESQLIWNSKEEL